LLQPDKYIWITIHNLMRFNNRAPVVLILVALLLVNHQANAQLFRINTINCKLNKDDLDLLNRMGKFEAAFYNQIFSTTKNDSVTVDINLYGRMSDYKQVRKITGVPTYADGYYSPAENRIYLYKSDRYMRTLLHETSHNLLQYNLARTPRWLTEGIASILENLVETTDNQILYMPQGPRVRQVRDSIRARTFEITNYFNISELDWMRVDKAQMMYSSAYSIIFFLINQHEDYLTQMLVLMKQGYTAQNALKKTFGSMEQFRQKYNYFYIFGDGRAL
jgi:hypothetical protein